jgi:hypothetical protein
MLPCWYMMHVDTWCMLIHDACWYMMHVDTWCMLIHDAFWYMMHFDTWSILIHDACWYMVYVDTWYILTHEACHVLSEVSIFRTKMSVPTSGTHFQEFRRVFRALFSSKNSILLQPSPHERHNVYATTFVLRKTQKRFKFSSVASLPTKSVNCARSSLYKELRHGLGQFTYVLSYLGFVWFKTNVSATLSFSFLLFCWNK